MGFNFDFPDDLTKQLEEIGDVDTLAPRIIDAALPKLEKAIVEGYRKHDLSGALSESIETKKAKKNKYGYYGYVTPTGNDERGTSNAEKAAYLEFGTSRQDATPVVTPAVNGAMEEALQTMQEEFDRIVRE